MYEKHKHDKETNDEYLKNILNNIDKNDNNFMNLINDYRNIISEFQKKMDTEYHYLHENIKNQDKKLHEVITFGKKYLEIDNKMRTEINLYYIKSQKYKCNIMNCLKT
jgi:hypothetical protein